MLLSILIPVRDDAENLRVCLRSLSEQDLSGCEVLVCDDGSKVPVDPRNVVPPGLNVSILRQPGQGPSAARNALARRAAGQYLFFLDADTVPCHETVAVVKKIIAKNPGIEAFFGSYDDAPEYPGLISTYRNLLHHYTHQQSAGGTVHAFWCGCGVILRDVYLENGGLSVFYHRPSIEDTELGMRLANKGVKVWVFSELQVKHRKRWTVVKWLQTDLMCRGIPWVRLMRSNNQWQNQLNFTPSQRIAVASGVCAVGLLAVSPFGPILVVPGAAALGLFVALNYRFFDLIRKKRGVLAAAATVPCHLVYALICVLSVVFGILSPALNLPPNEKLHPAR